MNDDIPVDVIPVRDRKLGKEPAVIDVKTIRLEPLMRLLPAPPVASPMRNIQLMAQCGMLGNDTHGDCVVADDGHDIMMWTRQLGSPVDINDAQALAFYGQASLALNGSAADRGLNMLAFLRWRRKTAWPAPINRPILGFGTFDHRNHTAIRQFIIATSSVRCGIMLPLSAQSQPAPGGVWDVTGPLTGPGTPGSWGGHDVPLVDYDSNFYYALTWGGVQRITPRFLDAYCDEVYGVIPTEGIPGFDMNGFVDAMRAIGAYEGPDPVPVPPSPTPTPTPPPTPVPQRTVTNIEGNLNVTFSDKSTQTIHIKAG